MIRSLIYSITFHSVLVLLTILSLPFMLREPVDLPPIVSVELIQITDKTSIPYAPKARKIIEDTKKKEVERLVSEQAPPAAKAKEKPERIPLPNEMKEEIVKPLREGLENNVFKTDHAVSEITGIINHYIAPREDVIRPYGNQPTDTVENEIAVRWNMFRKQVVAGDEYRKEDFRDVFPELWEIIKDDFFYSKLYERAKADPMYGAIDKGTFI